jgi:hypothetical protein
MSQDIKIVVERSLYKRAWSFHLKWKNGKIAMTSKMYTTLETTIELAKQIAERLNCELVLKE